jgi:hypothetical protein
MPMWDGSAIVDGSCYSKASIRFIFVDEVVEFTGEYAFSEKLEKAFGYGTNKSFAPIKQSPGKYVPGGLKVKGFSGGAQKMREKIAALTEDSKSYGTVKFPVMIQMVDSNESPIDIGFEGVSWEENANTINDSPDPLQDEMNYSFMRMNRNGLTLYDSSEEL